MTGWDVGVWMQNQLKLVLTCFQQDLETKFKPWILHLGVTLVNTTHEWHLWALNCSPSWNQRTRPWREPEHQNSVKSKGSIIQEDPALEPFKSCPKLWIQETDLSLAFCLLASQSRREKLFLLKSRCHSTGSGAWWAVSGEPPLRSRCSSRRPPPAFLP